MEIKHEFIRMLKKSAMRTRIVKPIRDFGTGMKRKMKKIE